MNYDRFEMEQLILNCWNIVDDINILNENVLEGDLSKDKISNVLIGISELYSMKFDKLFNMFEASIK